MLDRERGIGISQSIRQRWWRPAGRATRPCMSCGVRVAVVLRKGKVRTREHARNSLASPDGSGGTCESANEFAACFASISKALKPFCSDSDFLAIFNAFAIPIGWV
ncbi:hypothetical protein EJ03DRAFT_117251 [Teratosphaeria nubilosa]|uniref:Uncharacterized protein n=1 Tax=Teratosphaeria nubilosa TaxID=161662 RepID=A0A6G1L7B3_9PEZI|nr:hypothetical protein EJ03DRAFT_117251 [Teratosphaeria nubilosa]